MRCLAMVGKWLGCLAFCFVVVAAFGGRDAPRKKSPPPLDYWTVAEFQPNVPNGGRLNTFAVHPTTATRVLATSESGGLFRSDDGGQNWNHIDNLPCYWTNSVGYLPSDPLIVLLTASNDFKTTTGGGIWRSTDGGSSWTQMTLPAGVDPRVTAGEISFASSGAIYVACSSGVLKSTDQGVNWTLQDVFEPAVGDHRVLSVAALGADRVIAGGPAGIRYSSNGGSSWNIPADNAGSIWDLHALARSPVSGSHAYAANGNSNLYYTVDGGNHWTQIASAPGGGGSCGGIFFVKPIRRLSLGGSPRLELYYSNRCGVSKLNCPIGPRSTVNYSGTWTNLNSDHGDTRDLCFNGSAPYLLGTDGGIHKTTNGGANWTFTGGGSHGYNALQITEVQGQYIEDIGRHDLYFGTQDNDLWTSSNNGSTWPTNWQFEGFFIECQKRVATAADSKINFTSCGACNNWMTNPLFASGVLWPNPGGAVRGNPTIIRRRRHVQGVDEAPFVEGLAATSSLGSSWTQWASFTEDRRDIPKMALPGGGRNSEGVYQAIRTGWYGPGSFEVVALARIIKGWRSTRATVRYPAMTNFGGLGINPTMFAWYVVYGVDPGNYLHLIAPDVINEKMMESRDGGESWTEIPGLTALVSDGGRLRFANWMFPLVTSISFSQENPNYVLVGTSEGGVYVSPDNGANWSKLPGSEGITYSTGFHWMNANEIIASTYGRGLWRIQHRFFFPRPDFELYCRAPCFPEEFEMPGHPEWDRAILVTNGRILGARAVNGVAREVFVTPGSSVMFFTDESRFDLKVTRTTKNMGYVGVKGVPKAPKKGWITKALLMSKNNRLLSAVFGDREVNLTPAPSQKEVQGSIRSPIAGKPYIKIRSMHYQGGPVAMPNEAIRIEGKNFPPNAVLTVEVDGRSVGQLREVKIDGKGAFRVGLNAPRQTGIHRIEVKLNGKVIDGVMFMVKHEDVDRKVKQLTHRH